MAYGNPKQGWNGNSPQSLAIHRFSVYVTDWHCSLDEKSS